MRYGAAPNNLLEWLALKLDKAPLPVLDTCLAPMQARALIAAVRCGALATLAQRGLTTHALAQACQVDAECLQLVLRVVRAMGYVEQVGAGWQLSRQGELFFGTDAPQPSSAYVAFGDAQWRMMGALDEVLRTGLGIDFHATQSAADWQDYQRAMIENARSFAWFIADRVPVARGATRCLDLAGAHGLVGAELCRRHPGLHSTVFDRAEALTTALPLAQEHGYHELVSFRVGDLTRDALPPDQDVVLLCNIVHHLSEAENVAILQRVHGCLNARGTVAIFDIETPEDAAPAEAAGDAFALYFRLTSSSRCVRGADYASWLTRAGFHTRIVRSIKLPSRVLVLGSKR